MAGDTLVLNANFGAALAALGRFELTAELVTFADVMGPRLRERIREKAPKGQGPESGRLADSTRYQRSTQVGNVRMEFVSDVPYARYVIDGTRAHDIRPKAARVLHWVAPGGGDVFARGVHHPGTRANNYPLDAYREMRPQIEAEFTKIFERF